MFCEIRAFKESVGGGHGLDPERSVMGARQKPLTGTPEDQLWRSPQQLVRCPVLFCWPILLALTAEPIAQTWDTAALGVTQQKHQVLLTSVWCLKSLQLYKVEPGVNLSSRDL